MRLELEYGSIDEVSIERTTDRARSGLTSGIVRWVLLLTMILILLVFGLVVALSMRNDRKPAAPASPRPVPQTSG